MNRGAVYFAVGEQYLEEAKASARSVKEHSALDITLFTDQNIAGEPFDDVVQVDSDRPLLNVIDCLRRTPYDRTLFLDTDTYVAADISPVFDLLERYDICLAHAPNWKAMADYGSLWGEAPETFPLFNTGVVLYRDTPEVIDLFARWEDLYEENFADTTDQISFRAALWESDASVGTLQPNFNCFYKFPGWVNGRVRVLHGRDDDVMDWQELAERFNRAETPRVFTGHTDRRILAYPPPFASIRYPGPGRLRTYARRIRGRMQEDGAWETAKTVVRRLPRLLTR
ncbi:MAG: hypothetical protein ABEI97_03835 [Candidatus Nanohaloarchaea archaeon]